MESNKSSVIYLPGNKMQLPQVDIHPPIASKTELLYEETDGVQHWLSPKTKYYGLGSLLALKLDDW